DFKDSTEMKKVHTEEEFAAVYPFLPYQFNLLGTVLNSIRLNSASGKNLSEGERSMLGAYQEAAKSLKDEEDGVLVPFYRFYDNLVKFLDHTHASVIQRAQENSRLNPTEDPNCFTVNVLKTLFLLKYVDSVPLTIHNIRVLMRTNINDDLTSMKTQIDESLEVLMREMLVQPVHDQYEFLTDEEQDINREIERRNVQNANVIQAVTNMVFDEIYKITRYKVNEHGGRYTFSFNQAVDNHPRKGVQNAEIGLRLISPYYYGEDGGKVDNQTISVLSGRQQEAILLLPPDNISYIKDLRNSLKIDDYMRNVSDPQKGKSTMIRATKLQEAAQARERARESLEEAIGAAEIYVNGSKVTDIKVTKADERINEAMARLVETIYFKLQYMQVPKDDVDIRNLFKKDNQSSLDLGKTDDPNANALNDVKEFVSLSAGDHHRVSLKYVIDQFRKNPYGFTESDICYLVAKLFKEGTLSVMVDKEPITLFNREPEDLANYFTNRKYYEKIQMTVREDIPKNQRDNCRQLMKNLFTVTERTEDADKMMSSFMGYAKEMLDDCKEMLAEHDKVVPDYPGESALQDAIKLLTEIMSIKDTSVFFNKLMMEQTALFDMAEDIHPVRTFYRNESQKKIFRESGLRAIRFYESSKEHIVDEELEKVISEIEGIVRNKKPYKLIKDLPELYKRFVERYNITLNSKLEPVKQIIEQDKQTVLDKLSGTPFEDELKTEIITDFMELEKRASGTADISEMLGFKDKADSRCTIWLDKISQKLAQEAQAKQGMEGTGVGDGLATADILTPKQEKTVLARNITSDWRIETAEELEKYLDTLRKQIQARLDDDHIVIIKF
ncbi:MAG: BREX system P-loop protein BrxC, partial [Lachnospiraceae bacterium]|nr:BREX system P-loop protein BrxC [Lachnospiraceae bacterium]